MSCVWDLWEYDVLSDDWLFSVRKVNIGGCKNVSFKFSDIRLTKTKIIKEDDGNEREETVTFFYG